MADVPLNITITAVDAASTGLAGLKVNLQELGSAANAAGPGIGAMESNLKNAGLAADKAGVSFMQLRMAGVGLAELGGMSPGIANLGLVLSNVAGVLPEVGAGMLGAGAAAVVVGAGLVAATKDAIDFDYQMTVIRDNMNINDAQAQQLTQDVKTMSSASGAGWQDVANGIRVATNEGYNYADAQKIEDAAMKEAVGTGANVVDVTRAVSLAMHDYNLPASDAMKITEQLNTAFRDGNMTVQEGTQGMAKMTEAASSLHIPLEAVLASYTTLTRGLGSATVAGTQLTNLFKNLADPTSQATKEMTALDAQLGINLQADLQNINTTQGYSKVLMDLALIEERFPNILMKLEGGIRGGLAAQALANDKARDYTVELQAQGAATDAATTVTENYSRVMGTTKQRADELGQRMGFLKDAIGEPISNAAGVALEGLLKLGDGFDAVGSHVAPFTGLIVAAIPVVGQLYNGIEHGGELVNLAKYAIDQFGGSLKDLAEGAIKGVEDEATKMWDDLDNSTAANDVKDLLDSVSKSLKNLAEGVLSTTKSKADDLWTAAANSGAAHAAEGLISDVGSFVSGAGNDASIAAGQFRDFWAAAQSGGGAGGAGAAAAYPDESSRDMGGSVTGLEPLGGPGAYAPGAIVGSGPGYGPNALQGEHNLTTQPFVPLEGLSGFGANEVGHKRGGGGGGGGGAMGAAGDALKTTATDIATLRLEAKATTDVINGEFKPSIDMMTASLHADTAAHNDLKGVLGQVKSSQDLSTATVQKGDSAINEQINSLESQKTHLDTSKGSVTSQTEAIDAQIATLKAGKDALDNMTHGEEFYKAAVDAAKDAVLADQNAIKGQQEVIQSDQDAIKAANVTLTDYKNALSDLTSGLNAATTAETDFAHAALPGAQAFDDQKASIQQSMNELQLQIDQIIGTDLAKGMTTQAAEADPALAKLNSQLDVLKNQLDQVNLQASVTLDPMTQQIKDMEAAGNNFDFGTLIDQLNKAQSAGQSGLAPIIADLQAVNGKNSSSLTFAQITAGITAAQNAQHLLTSAIPPANAAVTAQQHAVDGLTARLDADQKALQGEQKALQADQEALQTATASYQNAQDGVGKLSAAVAVGTDLTNTDTTAVNKLTDARKTAIDQINNDTNPTIDAMNVKLLANRQTLQWVEDQVRSKNIPTTEAITAKETEFYNTLMSKVGPSLDATGAKLQTTSADGLALAGNVTSTLDPAMAGLGTTADTATTKVDAVDTAWNTLAAAPNITKTITINTVNTGSGGGGGGGAAGGTYSLGGIGTMPGQGGQLFSSASLSGQTFGGIPVAAVGTPVGPFDLGGVVPGSPGDEVWAMVHGAETILPPGMRPAAPLPRGEGGNGSSAPVMPINITGNTLVGTSTEMLQQIARMVQTEIERLITFAA